MKKEKNLVNADLSKEPEEDENNDDDDNGVPHMGLSETKQLPR